MDPFTQRMLEKAEQRSRALGISNAAMSNFPPCDKSVSSNVNELSGACATTMAMATASQQQKQPMHLVASADDSGGNRNKLHVIEKSSQVSSMAAPQKVLRQFSAVDKENIDLGIEINIVTDKNVEVQVEEQDFVDGECKEAQNSTPEKLPVQPIAKLRDTSRNRLQRLGALYSNTDDLSSPIHRTEGKFHAEDNEDSSNSQIRKPNQRLGKLAALASTINQWEDDTNHIIANNSSAVQPPPKPELRSRDKVTHEGKVCAVTLMHHDDKLTSKENENNKHLKWDSKVINSLEAQGFQRRDSSTVKMSYEFKGTKNDNEIIFLAEPKGERVEENHNAPMRKLNSTKFESSAKKYVAENKSIETEKKLPTIKHGLVSGRAAIFESQAQSSRQEQQQKPQKDPTELPLKERMKLFEKNKGEALIPKAAFGMAAPINKIIQDKNLKKEELTRAKTNNSTTVDLGAKSISSSVSVPMVKSVADSKVRDKVSALVKASAGNKIKEDIKKQREEDLVLLTNRFNKQRDFLHMAAISNNNESLHNKSSSTPPPPPPPLPANTSNINWKRRSPGDIVDEDSKRLRTIVKGTGDRLYPNLPNIQSTECSESDNENNWCTTATVSALSIEDEATAATQPLRNSSESQSDHYDQGDDHDPEDSYMESDGEDSSVDVPIGNLGHGVIHVVAKNNKQKQIGKTKGVHYADKDFYIGDNTMDTSNNSSDASMGVDDYLDEALEDDDNNENASPLSRDSKGTTASNSFSFRKTNTGKNEDNKENVAATNCSPNNAACMQPVKSELTVNKENDNLVTLVHTVSFYRKQQNANSASSTPIRKVCREQQVLRSAIENLNVASGKSLHFEPDVVETDEDTQSDSEGDDPKLIQEKIKKLLEEVCKQQQIITQTSQALNLCAATIEFSGSTEAVEGERHLLVASHRRQACLEEVQRIRVEKTLRPIGSVSEKGHLTIKEITIPLRQDYIRKLSMDTISGHHLVCLMKYNEHVLATKSVPTLPGLLSVKFPDVLQLNNVHADFKVTLEIYGMTAQREVLPHEVKYHINFNKKSGIKTPKKKTSDNRLVMPPVQSPAGPHAVRTPALVQYGFAIFSLREIQRTSWTLTQVLGVSPLEGIVHMKASCELSVLVQNKGFLTMFEDISGFGAWHRRWCHLNGTVLSFWKYPDDERKKAPIGTIDLYACSSQQVCIAPRDICARLNTMLLECQRPAKDTDHESLIIVPNGRTTTVRYLLSADTKQEREEWCAFFNKTLTLLRAWGPPQ